VLKLIKMILQNVGDNVKKDEKMDVKKHSSNSNVNGVIQSVLGEGRNELGIVIDTMD